MSDQLRVTVLRGGPSAEREVSLAGGEAVAQACRRLGCVVHESDISPDNLTALDVPADVVFPVLHGEFGEDGQLQAILQSRGLCYVGSDAVASRLAMDKDASKRTWQNAGLPTAPWACLAEHTDISAVTCPPPPVVIKPLCEGSSIGVVLCDTEEQLHAEAEKAISKHGKILVERHLQGPELTVGILDVEALPVIEIRTAVKFYDYEAKYRRDDTEYVLEPDIDAATNSSVRRTAAKAFEAIGCRDYGRVDFIVDPDEGPQLLEINTIPGFTSHSLLPKAAEMVGVEFDRLVEKLLKMASGR